MALTKVVHGRLPKPLRPKAKVNSGHNQRLCRNQSSMAVAITAISPITAK